MLKSGDTFGNYRVLELLGKGGMGAVYLLENAEGVKVAAKILDPATAGDHESRRRFVREAELALGVKHPNLVEVYDVGEDPDTGLCYILMEYVPGGSLADRIDEGPLAIRDAIRIAYQIASVLELARQKGVVHRDIKPGNILFGADGKAKLADLGIARGGHSGIQTTTVTQTGMMIGTPAYMAPEQMLDAHNVDIRADIYSLGIVFYEMLAGRRPNADDTVVQLMAKAVKGEPIPDVRTMRPEVSAAVAELVSLMCAMKADERIATPVEVTTALSQIVHGREVTIRRKAPKAIRRPKLANKLVFGCLSALAFVGIATSVYLGMNRSAPQPAPPASGPALKPAPSPALKPEPSPAPRPTTPLVAEESTTVANSSLQIVIDASRGGMYGRVPFFEFRPGEVYASGLEIPVRATSLHFPELRSLDLTRASVYIMPEPDFEKMADEDLDTLGRFVDGGGTLFVQARFRTDVPPSALFRRFAEGGEKVGSAIIRKMGKGRVVCAPAALFREKPYSKDETPETRENRIRFWRDQLSVVAREGRLVPAHTPFPDEDPAKTCVRSFTCQGVTFYERKSWEPKPPDMKPVMERLLPILDRVRGGTLADNGLRRVFLSGGIIDAFAVNGPQSGLPDDVFLAGTPCCYNQPSAMTVFAFATCFAAPCKRMPLRHPSVPMDHYSAALAVTELVRTSPSLVAEPVNNYGRRRYWDVSSVATNVSWRTCDGILERTLSRSFGVFEELRKERPDFVAEYFRKVRETKANVHHAPVACAVLSKVFGRNLAPRFRAADIRFDFAAATREYDRLCGKAVSVPPPGTGVTDRRIRYAKVGGRNWFYSLENGEAVLWRGNNGYNNETKPCVEPSPEGEIEIPSELDGHKVAVIGNLAFFRCGGITAVTIPEGVREIRGWAFLDCDRLADIGIPTTMESMKSGAFCSCRALRSVDIGKCPDVLGSTFWNCSSLEEIRVSPDNPSYVSGSGSLLARKSSTLVFHSRTRKTVDWPRNLREIGEGAFLNSRIRELDLPDTVEIIGKNAFFNCHSLARIGLGSGLKDVGSCAFMFCGRLRELDFPKSLVRLGGSVADGCSALNRIVFRGNAPTVELVRGSVWGKLPDALDILVAPGSKGWNGPGSSDLPEKWPAGNFDDSRPIRYLGTQADGSMRPDVSSLAVEAPEEFAKEKAKLEEMLGKIVPALNGLMGGTLKTAGRRIVVSDKCRGYSVSRDGNTLTLSPGMSGFPKQTTGVGERVAVFLSGLGRKGSAHTESCAGAMDWYLSFRLRERLGNRFDSSEKFKGDLSGLGRNALKKDPEMTLYDLRGESQNRKARKLQGSEKSTFAQEKCFWLFEQMRARNSDAIAGFLMAWEREQAAGNLADPVSQDDVAALFSIAVGEDLFDWFSAHGMPSSPERTRVKAKFTGTSTPEGWLDDLEIAKARAKASGKMILAAFEGSDWCGWCKKMEKDVYTQPDFMPRVTPRFVPVYIDKPRDRDLLSEKCRERNPELHGEYNIRGVPCVVILDAEGKEIGRVGGYKQNVDALMERVDALVGRAQEPSADVCTDEKRKRKTAGKTSTPAGMTDDFEAACEQAKKEKKRMLLVFSGSDWCGFCKRLDDDVLSEKKFIRQISRKFVPIYIDSPRDRSLLSAKAQDQNPRLIDRYSPNGYPTVVVTDADGEELARFSGYGGGGSSVFMRRLEDSVKESERERKRRK